MTTPEPATRRSARTADDASAVEVPPIPEVAPKSEPASTLTSPADAPLVLSLPDEATPLLTLPAEASTAPSVTLSPDTIAPGTVAPAQPPSLPVASALTLAPAQSEPAILSRAERLRLATDRVPTAWFASIATGAFLIGTAAFGGLADVAAPPVATLETGAAFTTDQVTLEVQDVVVIDDLPELYLDVPAGHRVVAVLAHATNEWTEPQSATAGLRDVLRLEVDGLADARPLTIVRVDDNLTGPLLQPGLRVPLAFIWTVPSTALAGGDEVTVDVFGQTLLTGQVVTSGQWWDDPTLAATMTTAVEDLGGGE